MGDLFYWLFNMSIVGALAGLAVVLIRLIKRIPRRWIVLLWMIPLLRFLIPVGVGGKYSLMSLLSRFATRTVVIYEGELSDLTITNTVQAADRYFPITYKVDLLADVFHYAGIVWAIIAAALILAMVILYAATISELRNAEQLRDNIYCSPKVSTPAVYGVLRPRIILPESCRESKDLDLIVLHERRHIRRLDNLWRVLAFLTAAIHWFNPASWLFLKLYLEDAELACDESLLSKLSADEHKRYAHALLSVREGKTVFASGFGGAKVRTRIERILSYRKMTAASVIAFAALLAAIAYFLLTNASARSIVFRF